MEESFMYLLFYVKEKIGIPTWTVGGLKDTISSNVARRYKKKNYKYSGRHD